MTQKLLYITIFLAVMVVVVVVVLWWTMDSVTVFVNAIMYYKVANATSAIANVNDYSVSVRLLAATTLRNVLGTKKLGYILSERESIAQEMETLLHKSTAAWGCKWREWR